VAAAAKPELGGTITCVNGRARSPPTQHNTTPGQARAASRVSIRSRKDRARANKSLSSI
jgi:hypothetical protein